MLLAGGLAMYVTEVRGAAVIKELVQRRLDTGEWWVLISASPIGRAMAQAIETAFYSGLAASGMESTLWHSDGTKSDVGLHFARKANMSLADFRIVAEQFGVQSPEQFGEAEHVIFPHDTPSEIVEEFLLLVTL